MGFSRKLCLLFLCSGWIFEAIGRAIPNTDAVSGSALGDISRRVGTSEFATMYDLYDQSNPSSKALHVHDGDPHRLRPIGVVLKTMQATSQVTSPPLPLDQPTAVAQPSPTAAYAVVPSPFHFGPGPLLTSSAYNSAVSANPALNNFALGHNSNATVPVSKHLTVLGIIIGGILFFTVCVFILMSPSDLLSGWFKRAGGKDDKIVRETEKPLHSRTSWVTIPSPSSIAEQSSLEGAKEADRRVRDTVIEVVAALSASESKDYPTSKFSVCSSEYAPSSTYTSDLASNTSTVKALPMISKHFSDLGKVAKPNRPPRPPTTDSPRLSDSVYLACSDSDQPYVIVAPQPLTNDDFSPGIFAPKPSRKFLTSTEFVALHLRITGGHMPPGTKRSSLDSRHYRTKSAPALGQRKRTSCLKTNIPPSKSLVSEKPDATSIRKLDRSSVVNNVWMDDTDGNVQESIVRRITKHRRSRSASGWAYPSKGRRARRPFKLEEE